MRFIFKGYLLIWVFLLLLARYRSLALMMQISNKVFMENGDRPLFSPVLPLAYRLLDLTKIRG